MLKTTKLQLPGGSYELTQVTAHPDGLRLFHQVHTWLGPLLGAVGGLAAAASEGGDDLPPDALSKIGVQLGAMLAEPRFRAVIEEYWSLGGLRCDGRPVRAEEGHWDEHMGDYYGAVFLALKANVFPAFSGLAGRLPPKLSELLERPPAA